MPATGTPPAPAPAGTTVDTPRPAAQLRVPERPRLAGSTSSRDAAHDDKTDPRAEDAVISPILDCSDGELLARFWSGVTGWQWSKQEMPGNPF